MALKAYTPPRREIKVQEQVLGEVRGLSLEGVATLVRTHLPDLEAVAELFDRNNGGELLAAQDWLNLATPLITQAPGLVANIIAIAADEPTKAPNVQTWPFSVQVAALMVIFDLTFSEIGEIKKVLEMIATLRAQRGTEVKKATGIKVKRR